MKRSVKIGIRVLAFSLLLGLILSKIYQVLSWKDTTGGYLSVTSQLYHTPENTIDVLFMGSSHCYCSIYPVYLWEQAGISAFDMAVSGQDKDSTYHMLLEALKTQSPKVVCVELYGLTFETQKIEGNVYRNMLAMKPSRNAFALINDYVEPEKRMDFYLRWPIIHTRYQETDKFDYIPYEPSLYGRGGDYQWHIEVQKPGDTYTAEIGELTEKNEKWLSDLVCLQEEKGFELVFFAAPFNKEQRDLQLQVNAARQWIDERGYPVIDFNELRYRIGLDDETDYVDVDHTNADGAKKITDYFYEQVLKNYDLPDHRGDGAYESWEWDRKWFAHLYLEEQMKEVQDPETLGKLLQDREDVLTVIYAEDVPDGKRYLQDLKAFDLQEADLRTGGIWFYQNGTLTKMMELEETAEDYSLDLSAWDSMRIRYRGYRDPSNIMINLQGCVSSETGVTLVVYDQFLKKVLGILPL